MRTFEFSSEEQVKNLAIFLNRVQLTGAEVPAYLEIVRQINKPILDIAKKSSTPNSDLYKKTKNLKVKIA